MRRRAGIGVLVLVAAALSGAATAQAAPADRASCAAILTSFEATELPAGFVGAEVSSLAGPDFGGVASGLGKAHLGSLEECATIAP